MPFGSRPVAAAVARAAPLAAIHPLLKGRACAWASCAARLPLTANTANAAASGFSRGSLPDDRLACTRRRTADDMFVGTVVDVGIVDQILV